MFNKVSLAAFVSLALAACTKGPDSPHTSSTSKLTVQSFGATEKGLFVTSTLVLGEHDALLVDAQFLDSEAARLVDTIRATGRNLRAVYVTHAHPDHYFGLATIHHAFPDAVILAHPKVAEAVRAGFKPKHDQWKPVFGADLSDVEVDATPYDKPTIDVEGRTVQLIGPDQGDEADSVAVFVPDTGTLIAGDVSYAGTHVWLANTKPAQWNAWLSTLQRFQAMKPRAVVSGHRETGQTDSAEDLAATARYIEDFKTSVASAHSADEVIKTMGAKYPSRKLPIVLQFSAKAAFGS
jgi:glyoxylase-like metal-dependent hydrolase (beta-lactamase superfamily II)